MLGIFSPCGTRREEKGREDLRIMYTKNSFKEKVLERPKARHTRPSRVGKEDRDWVQR